MLGMLSTCSTCYLRVCWHVELSQYALPPCVLGAVEANFWPPTFCCQRCGGQPLPRLPSWCVGGAHAVILLSAVVVWSLPMWHGACLPAHVWSAAAMDVLRGHPVSSTEMFQSVRLSVRHALIESRW
jgi:hypothetical protein